MKLEKGIKTKAAAMVFTLLSASAAWASDNNASSVCDCDGETGTRWENNHDGVSRTGGCVGGQTRIADNVFIAPSAKVCGSAEITGSARIFGQCVVTGQSKIEDLSCYGNARIDGNAQLSGEFVRVFENAHITGDAALIGPVKVRGDSRISSASVSANNSAGNGALDDTQLAVNLTVMP